MINYQNKLVFNSVVVFLLTVIFCITPQLFAQETRSNIFPLPEQAYTAEYYFNRGTKLGCTLTCSYVTVFIDNFDINN